MLQSLRIVYLTIKRSLHLLPNQNLPKNRALCKCKILSLTRLDHSCIQNAQLEMVNYASTSYDWGYAYANVIVVMMEDLHIFRLGAITPGGRNITSGDLS